MNSNDTFSQALHLRNNQRPAAALAMLLTDRKYLATSAPACGLIATLYLERRDPKNAAKWFAKTTKIAPRSEAASLGLFHSLWELGKRDLAFDEMRRFLLLADSAEYTRLLRDIQKELPTPGEIQPGELPMEDRLEVNAAEKTGLEWRRVPARKLVPLRALEVQNV